MLSCEPGPECEHDEPWETCTEEKWGERRCNWCGVSWTCEQYYPAVGGSSWVTSRDECSCYDENDRYREDWEGCAWEE
ncbi:MAG: hypothetical protein FJ102_02695 [Deltaproteobacteria bacterium]|nr:hypothetical protein [Deltaproteobacteria bacterium]